MAEERVKPRRRLFRKYVVVFVSLVGGALLASGLIEIYFSYQENKAALVALEREKAAAAASRIDAFIKEIERQIGWTTQPQVAARSAALDQRRFDFLRLLRQVPAITEISYLDPAGREQLRISRLAMDVVGSGIDVSGDPRFVQARAHRTYYGPVYFRKESEPYMTIAMAGSGSEAGVTAAEVNLKFIWDVVSQIKVGHAGQAYVVDGGGALIAHPDISLVLQKTVLRSLPQVAAAIAGSERAGEEEVIIARDPQGRHVLTAHAPIAPLGWSVFVEQPVEEAFAPLRGSLHRTILLVLLFVGFSVVAGLVLARRMVTPINALQAGAARIGAGDLGERIAVRTGDELETLADQFNSMAAQLRESYANLEQKVEARTRELSEALEQQTATAEILRVISRSPTELQPVFDTILTSALRLCEAQRGALLRFDGDAFETVAQQGATASLAEYRLQGTIRPGPHTALGRLVRERRVVQIEDVRADLAWAERDPLRVATVEQGGTRTLLAVPMLKESRLIGAITVHRGEVRPFTDKQVSLLQTFADQAVIAVENVRLFTELQQRTQDLAQSLGEVRALSEVTQAVGSSLDLRHVLDTIMRHAVALAGCDACAVFEYQPARHAFAGVASHNLGATFLETIETTAIDPQRGAIRRATETGRPFQYPDVADAPDYMFAAPTLQAGFRALLAIPMGDQDITRGLVLFRRRPGVFEDRVVELLTALANQSRVAIDNARLFQELESQRLRLERLSRTLEQLYKLSTAVQEPLSLTDQLTRVLAAARQVVDIDRFYVWAVSPGEDTVVAMAGAGFSEEERQSFLGTEIPLAAAGAMAKAYREGMPLIFDEQNPLPPELKLKPPYAAVKGARTRNFMVIPMIARGRTVGLLTGDNRVSGRPILPQTVEMLQTFASHAAVALVNARLFQEIEEKSRQLQVANRHKSEFLANMSHELRTPLNAVIGFSEVLLERMFGELNDKQAEYLEDILSSGRHLLSLINDILDLAKVEAGRMELEVARFSLPLALDNALTLVRERAARHGVTIGVDVDPRLGDFAGDERKIKQVLLNLLSNAVKFTPEGGRVTLHAGLANGGVEVAVSDTGIGIAPEDQAAIFEEFQQVGGDYARKREGTGLGLTLARKFVELHGGTLRVRSEVGQGSTFTLTLPIRPWPAS